MKQELIAQIIADRMQDIKDGTVREEDMPDITAQDILALLETL